VLLVVGSILGVQWSIWRCSALVVGSILVVWWSKVWFNMQ
jgi:hypothetical protein